MSDEQLKFFGFENLSSKIELDAPADKSVFESINSVFRYNEPFYKHYYSHKVVKYCYNTVRSIRWMVMKFKLKFKDIFVKIVVN